MDRLTRLLRHAGVFLVCLLPATAQAQSAKTARLVVTVVDPSGAIVAGATVNVIGVETATKDAVVRPVKTTPAGTATFDGLLPGRYSLQGEFPGFELGLVAGIRLQAGDNKHGLILPIKKVQDAVTVGVDRQATASTRAAVAFGLTLTKEEIDALSDDPTEMARQLADLAGLDAIIRVDSFEGQQLPPRAQIKSIHVTRDQFAAETETPGSTFVDVITQAGAGPLRGGLNSSFHDARMSAKSPFTPTNAPGQRRGVSVAISAARSPSRRPISRCRSTDRPATARPS